MYAPNSTEGRVSRKATRQQWTGTYPVQMDSAETGARAQRSLSESPGSKSRAPAHSGSRSRQTPRGRLAPGAWGGVLNLGLGNCGQNLPAIKPSTPVATPTMHLRAFRMEKGGDGPWITQVHIRGKILMSPEACTFSSTEKQ